MRTQEEIKLGIEKRKGTLKLMKVYLQDRTDRMDWHGVEDAASDIRDVVAAIQALEWVLGVDHLDNDPECVS